MTLGCPWKQHSKPCLLDEEGKCIRCGEKRNPCAVCSLRPAEYGVYCKACLDSECATISDEDLDAAAAIFDRLVAEQAEDDVERRRRQA